MSDCTTVIRNGKMKTSLETWAVLLFLPEREIFGMAVQTIHQNIKKW